MVLWVAALHCPARDYMRCSCLYPRLVVPHPFACASLALLPCLSHLPSLPASPPPPLGSAADRLSQDMQRMSFDAAAR